MHTRCHHFPTKTNTILALDSQECLGISLVHTRCHHFPTKTNTILALDSQECLGISLQHTRCPTRMNPILALESMGISLEHTRCQHIMPTKMNTSLALDLILVLLEYLVDMALHLVVAIFLLQNPILLNPPLTMPPCLLSWTVQCVTMIVASPTVHVRR